MIHRNPAFSRPVLSLAIILFLMTLVSMPALADTYSFYLGPQPNPTPVVNNESVGPYPGLLTDTTSNTVVSEAPFMCLDGNITTNWGSTLTGTISAPVGASEDEAAFLSSLLISDAAALGVTPDSYTHPNPPNPYTPAYTNFINNYAAPITFAIWQLMGTLPGGAVEPAGTQAFVNQAIAEYNNVFNNPSSSLYAAGQAFLASVIVFNPIPTGSNQRFITAPSSPLTTQSVPEPTTLGLLAAGLIAFGVGRKRFGGRQ